MWYGRCPIDGAAVTQRPAAETDDSRRLTAALAIIALIVAVPMLSMGVHDRIDYDSWWHVFIAREAPWDRFWRDVYRNAHPPLFYLLLSAVARLGTERLVYRSISIAAALVATYLVGLIAARTMRRRGLALLCALAFGLAVPTAAMACAVRSYMLSLAFLLLAFRLYLDLIDPTRARVAPRTRIAFALGLIGAIVSHYAAVFFVAAAAALPCLYAALDRRYRTWLGGRLRTRWRAELATALPVAAVIGVAYAVHMSRWSEPMVHTAAFYPGPTDRAAGLLRGGASFLARAIVAEIDLFSPLPLASLPAAARPLLVLLAVAAAVGLALRLRRRASWPVAAAPLVMLAMLVLSLMGAALASRYPFGGFLRQQYVLFPFIMLSGFGLLDAIAERGPSPRMVIALWGAVLLNAVVQWRHVYYVDVEPLGLEVARFDQLFPDPAGVYVDQFGLIPYFAGHQRAAWTTQTALGETFHALPVQRRPRPFVVLRDMTRWNANPSDPGLYADLRQLLARTALPAIDVFHLRQDAPRLPMPPGDRADAAETIIRAAASQGVHVERLVLDGFQVYARVVPARSSTFGQVADHDQDHVDR